jgi:SAM-dependent methyltransferase
VDRNTLPVFQNVVYPTSAAALTAPSAPFTLATCRDCGFSFNGRFDPTLVVYDERYDNSVPSTAFRSYYQSLVDMLVERYGLTDGAVYEVGCGNGEFLSMLCASAPGVRGIGIDPSCEPLERDNLQLVRAFLEPSHFRTDTRLVLVRHVLEHIADPVGFMAMIRAAMPDEPAYIEVPALEWILENDAAWDFCYEHCNYFTQDSLAVCLRAAGYSIDEQQRSFGGQYQWAICRPAAASAAPAGSGAEAVRATSAYSSRERDKIDSLRRLAEEAQGVAVWGMATKGVMVSLLIGPEFILGGIDGNPAKQGAFAASSGVQIHPPIWCRSLPHSAPILVMNPNYAGEIREFVASLGVKRKLLKV